MSRCKACDAVMKAPVPLEGYCGYCQSVIHSATQFNGKEDEDDVKAQLPLKNRDL